MASKKLGIGIDLGTTNLLVYVEGNGIIFNEPSVVAFDVETKDVIAGGTDAFSMIGKEHKKIKVSRPLRDGVISDMDAAKAMLKYVFERVQNIRDFHNATCLICCPSEVTQIEREAMRDLAIQMGIKDVFIEEEIKAGAIGAGIDIYSPSAAMVIDIGGGTTDVGVLSLGDVVLSHSIRVAGNYIDQEIIKYVHKHHNLIIGQKSAERAKIKVATLLEDEEEERVARIAGRDLVTGLPRTVNVTSQEIKTILQPIFQDITNVAYTVLEQTPPELAADIVDNGIIVDGGGALIPGVKEYFESMLSLPVRITENPLTAVVQGTKVLLRNKGSYIAQHKD
ncbi:rod shape-determining protein [Haloplasma contractile]|uniref:Cell shape-determining protein MreB n=1 Tax=Haloplasma contractile SSD-17B TaxID=1033810 RepID=U2E8B4_9MOLU|nr:rod shape-determining protein [Haloplasma contractile]ERJ11131.1 dihydrolipoamide dehydrogenase protein [Haloplasma contractile SSD-17B]